MKDDFTHHYKRRAFYHDYKSPAIYHVTLNKSNEAPLFGNLTGDYRIKNGEPGCVRVELSMLGTIIRVCPEYFRRVNKLTRRTCMAMNSLAAEMCKAV